MRCQVCGKGDRPEGAECRYCGATVRSVLGQGKPLPPEVNDELYVTRQSNRARQSRRRRKRLVWHTVAGAIVLFGVAVWVCPGSQFKWKFLTAFCVSPPASISA